MKDAPRWLWPTVIGGLVIVLAVVALIREPVELDPTSPEGTVQGYLQAISDDDYNTAFEALDPESFEGCTAASIQRARWHDTFTASLPEATDPPEGDNAFVEVTMHFGQGGVFGGGWDSDEVFILISRDDVWWITDDPWPYFKWDCARKDF